MTNGLIHHIIAEESTSIQWVKKGRLSFLAVTYSQNFRIPLVSSGYHVACFTEIKYIIVQNLFPIL